jgi:hypothetical protein
VYQISRSMYRRLSPRVLSSPDDPTGSRNREVVLKACEAAIVRLAKDRRYFAHPSRSLFNEIRRCFSIRDQVLVYWLVERHMELADDFLERLPDDARPFGEERQCRATTRGGSACRREPLPAMDYCPSHKHLEEPDAWKSAPTASGAEDSPSVRSATTA